MDTYEIMRAAGYEMHSSGGGCTWYTKMIKYDGKEAYVAVTDDDGLRHPESLDEPIIVGIYDVETGELMKPPQSFYRLKQYLGSKWIESIGGKS